MDGNISIPIEQLLIPLWILDGLVVIVALVLCVTGYRHSSRSLVIGGLSTLLGLVPWVVFEVLLVLQTYQMYAITPMMLLTPLIVWFALLFVLFSGLGCVCWYN
eukprot:TRINITY_DN10816_c0_g1_i2.p1 TRINITY_DN10816_c0_g1~~TRINITY_DN10816_c0_g1_i2.p1  ORF type:complete len:104 (-),score=13.76 TRINITY_DN10816_c0_g1_i2:35-346(-)